MKKTFRRASIGFLALLLFTASAFAQSVCLPAPRLLTTMPMGAQVGATLEVVVTAQHLEEAKDLHFSHPGITAKPKLDAKGKPEVNKYIVTVAKDVPAGVHEARLMTRLGATTSRAFSVGSLTDVTRTKANTTIETAMELKVNFICNAVMTKRAADYYSFEAVKGQRLAVDCAARGIDSKLNPVVIIADSAGSDLLVERLGGALDFTAPADGKYFIKVHDLTYQGGAYFFYRLALTEAPAEGPIVRLPSTRNVNSFSWSPVDDPKVARATEVEPNNKHAAAQKISLPCDISGGFFPAADVDTFEFNAKKGEVWWVEVGSERMGLPTDPFVLVQRVEKDGDKEKLTDVAELNDIPSAIKPSSNGYSYDGPAYTSGSADVLGKFEAKADGVYRLQLRDLFGGTRKDPKNVYRLIVRKAAPDYAVVAWSLHMNLRNGDRAALSKPMSLRGGATMALEVAVIRKDGFTGPIELGMEGLPKGVSAGGLRIPAGKLRGIMLVTAEENAPRGVSSATMFGVAQIDGKTVRRPCQLASMTWPVKDAKQEIPKPRLLADVPVSVGGSAKAPLTIAPAERKVWEVAAGGKLTIPLKHTRREDFSGSAISLKTFGDGFDRTKAFEATLTGTRSEAVLDLAALKTPPGDYLIAFYGSAVAKHPTTPGAKKTIDIVDIIITEPIPIRVKPAEKK